MGLSMDYISMFIFFFFKNYDGVTHERVRSYRVILKGLNEMKWKIYKQTLDWVLKLRILILQPDLKDMNQIVCQYLISYHLN